MLFLTLLVTTATGSVSLLVCWVKVVRTARAADTRIHRADVVVVFGVRLDRAGNPGPDYQSRLRRALLLRGERPLMILGGATGRDSISEAAAGRFWLAENGWKGKLVVLEDRSRNTLENLHYVREAMRRYGYILPALVTSRYHLARSGALAAGLGIPHELCAAEERHGFGPRIIAKSLFEAVILHWYYVGKS
jgi:uncharacterized SAM-binding protein YcdF (DUF218 family)